MKQFAVILITFLFAHGSHAQMTCPPSLSADVCAFETKAYTKTDFKKTDELRNLFVEFKKLLMAHAADTPMIQGHILDLGNQIVEEAYAQRAPKDILAIADGHGNLQGMLTQLRKWESKHGQIVPLDWHLPAGFSIGIAALDRSYNVSTDRLRFSLSFFGTLEHPLEVEQFKISRYGGATVIDKARGIGDWHSGNMEVPKLPYISAGSVAQETPPQDGLYLLTIQVKGEPAMNGWFFLRGTSTSSPGVFSPKLNETYSTPTPTFRFQDFHSSSTLLSDSRKRTVSVSNEGNNASVWKASMINSIPSTSVTVGQEKNQLGINSLEPGSYRLYLAFEERSYFGDLTIGRVINTTVPFKISK